MKIYVVISSKIACPARWLALLSAHYFIGTQQFPSYMFYIVAFFKQQQNTHNEKYKRKHEQ